MKRFWWLVATTIITIVFFSSLSLSQNAYTIAERVVVKIDTPSGSGGSGVIVERDNNRYTIVTNCHVLQQGGSGTYRITTYRKTHTLNIPNPQSYCYPNQVDLANLTLTTNDSYTPATFAESTLQRGQRVIAAGFPALDGTSAVRDLATNPGEITKINSQPLRGYGFLHSAKTLQGMSGGGIFNEQGELLAINALRLEAPDVGQIYNYTGVSISFYSPRQSRPEAPGVNDSESFTLAPSLTIPSQPTPQNTQQDSSQLQSNLRQVERSIQELEAELATLGKFLDNLEEDHSLYNDLHDFGDDLKFANQSATSIETEINQIRRRIIELDRNNTDNSFVNNLKTLERLIQEFDAELATLQTRLYVLNTIIDRS